MKFSKTLKPFFAVLIFTILAVNGSYNNSVKAQRGRCGNQTICSDPIINLCIPLPTTLPAVSSTYNGGYGFSVASGNCGAKRCWWLFTCRCGPSLGAGICNSGSSSGNSCSREEMKNVK